MVDRGRSASMPKKNKNESKTFRKNKSATFKERLRSTFSRSLERQDTNQSVVYGKLVLLGDQAVGKTSIAHRFSHNYFTQKYTPTTGTELYDITALVQCEDVDEPVTKESVKRKTVNMRRTGKRSSVSRVGSVMSIGGAAALNEQPAQQYTKEFKFQLVDNNSEVNQSSPISYRAMISDAHGFILVCSYDNLDSIEYIKNVYEDIKILRSNKTVPVIIIANKRDVSNDVSDIQENLDEFINATGIKWCAISTNDAEGFEVLTELLLNEMHTFDEAEEEERSLSDDLAFVEEEERYKHTKTKFSLFSI